MKFLDEVTLQLTSGHGGPGCISFRREKFIEYGGPNGGNGGKGGDVVLVAVANLNTLIDYRYTKQMAAENGRPGEGSLCTGRDGADLVLRVPVGTAVLDAETDEQLADMLKPGETIRLLKGGDGGMGNAYFKSSTNRAPRKAGAGYAGQTQTITLRLKLIADAGLVGLPNAGKSTFLAATTAAKPKIADYPFTTLTPNLGVVRVQKGREAMEFVLADIPGLIEGARDGTGLGDKFLAHIERCRVLLHLMDATSDDVVGDYKIIRAELKAYGAGLARKPSLLGLNKCDALSPADVKKKKAQLEKLTRKKVFTLSAIARHGTDDVLLALWQKIRR